MNDFQETSESHPNEQSSEAPKDPNLDAEKRAEAAREKLGQAERIRRLFDRVAVRYDEENKPNEQRVNLEPERKQMDTLQKEARVVTQKFQANPTVEATKAA